MASEKTTIFSEKILSELPVTYRQMYVTETKNVGELYLKSVFSKSKKHFSNDYQMYISGKPISNFSIK
jgi:uncharacterized protein with ATP-grasp and redox domains